MSVINQMLQDLEKRRAGAIEGSALPNQVRPLPSDADARAPSSLAIAGVALVVVTLGGVAWWSTRSTVPPPVVARTPSATDVKPADITPPVTAISPAVTAPSVTAVSPVVIAPPQAAAATPNTASTTTTATPVPPPAAQALPRSAESSKSASKDRLEKNGLRLSSSLTLPIEKTTSRARLQLPGPPPSSVPALMPAPTSLPKTESPAPARVESPAKPRVELASGGIDKQARAVSPRDRAEAEYRRGSIALSQGRPGEAAEALRLALTEDPTYDAARQALVGLLIEQRRNDEAQKLLQETLGPRPNQPGFAMMLARMQVDAGDNAAALATLSRTLPFANDHADFLAFSAAMMQRAGRHAEAIEQYRVALRLKPDASVWWMGLGISLQASDRASDALDAYKRAQTGGNLSPELLAFVAQRIKQVSP